MLKKEFIHVKWGLSWKDLGKCTILISFLFFLTLITQDSKPQEPEDVAEENTVCIKARLRDHAPGRGAGLILNNDGYCITAYHVIEDANTLLIRSLHCRREFERRTRSLLHDYSEEEDAAVLRLPQTFMDAFRFGDVIMIDSVSTGLRRKPVWIWTGCSRGGFKNGIVSRVKGSKIHIGNISGLQKGDSGTPVFLDSTGEFVGVVAWAIDPIKVPNPDSAEDSLIVEQKDFELVSVEAFKRILPENPSNVLQRNVEFENDSVNMVAMENIDKDLDALQAYMEAIKERKSLIFEDKSHYDLMIDASLEASTFVKYMKQRIKRGETLTGNRALAVWFYIRGLETKATKNNGFEEAMEYFEMALDVDPSFAEALNQRALFNLTFEGEMERALEDLILAAKYDPENPEVVRSFVVFYLISGEYDLARTYLEKADSLLDSDPRIPLYWGVFYDPTWNEGLESEGRVRDMNRARVNYIKSLQKEPYFITPANNLNWTFLRELEQDDSVGILSAEEREDLENKLRTGLYRLQPYVDWGFSDPRALETFAHSYAYLSQIGTDKEQKKEDCRRACEYVATIEKALQETELTPRESVLIQKGLEYSRDICGCKGN